MPHSALINTYETVRKEYQQKVVLPQDRQQYLENNEILFSTHSCAIEGNSFSVDDTRALKELGLGMVVPKGKKLYECFEMHDHLNAYEFVLDNLSHPLDEAFLKEVNRRLTEHTLTYHAADAVPGEYTTVDMAAGDTIFGEHEKLIARVPRLLASTEEAINEEKSHPMVIAARFHGYFIYLHPFRDGNGRTGRLISNYILMRMNHPPLIIKSEERSAYIAALKQIKHEGTDEFLVSFFLDTAIRHMKEDIQEKQQNTKPKLFLF